jgi:hypothetical protein
MMEKEIGHGNENAAPALDKKAAQAENGAAGKNGDGVPEHYDRARPLRAAVRPLRCRVFRLPGGRPELRPDAPGAWTLLVF